MLSYLIWHYRRGVKNFLVIWQNFLGFFWDYFSAGLLLRSLIAPWKRDVNPRGRGFDLEIFFQTLVLNILSRLIGALIRSTAIILALLLELITLLGGLFLFFVWLFFPLLIIYLLLSGVLYLFDKDYVASGYSRLAFGGLALCLAWLFYYQSKKKLPSAMSLAEMMDKPWFDLVWERAGIKADVGQNLTPENVGPILKESKLSEEDFKEIVSWVSREREKDELAREFWRKENLLARRGIGKDWSYAYTPNLDKFSVELGAPRARKFKSYLIGREKDIEQIERILVRAAQNNVLVVGEAGTGRKTVVKGFADFVYQGRVLPPLQHKRVLELSVGAALAGAANTSEMEARLQLLFSEAVRAGNIILVIDDFHNFVGAQTGLGKIDISGLIMPYLGSNKIQLICIVTNGGLHKNIEANSALLKLFERVDVQEPDEKNSILILEDVAPKLESRINVRVTFGALKEIVSKAAQYFGDVPMPERAIDLLDESMVYVATKKGGKVLKVEDIDAILSEKTRVPIGEVAKEEKEKLVGLEGVLHQRVINQEQAIVGVASAMRRARLGIGEKKKPIGSFLFLGPTGVGKTETAKALAQAYFGQEERMIRLDMSEYQNAQDLARLIGTAQGETGYLVTQVRENPFSLLLLDEIEKAHPNILNLFLQVLDEGWLTDAWGRKTNFRNTIIVATSNAGAELIRETVAGGIDLAIIKEKILDYIQKQGIFRPEFLNRFDGVIIYEPLTKENLVKIAQLQLAGLAKRLAEQEINFVPTIELAQKVAELGYAPEFGARPMKRVIQDKIEDLISRRILSGEIQKGQTIEIRPQEL